MTTHPTRRLTRYATLLALGLATCATLPVTTARAAAEDDEAMTKSDAPATKPSAAAAPAGRRGADFRRGGDGPLQRLRENADKLGLTADQKKEIERIAADAREKSRQVFADAKGDRDKVRREMGDVFRDAMQQMREVLTPEQQRKVRDLLEQGPGMRRAAAAAAGSDDEMMMADGRAGTGEKAEQKRPAAKEAVAKPKVAVDPATVEFTRLDGKTVPISTYKGKPLVLIFGSYSCPSFREHAKAIDELQRRYATKANFLVVYTREAHPVGGWEVQRNKDAEISVQPHKDEAARLAAAKQARGTLGLSIPMAVDTMDDQLAAAFDAFPNGCVILGREGKVVARQKWAEVRGIRAALDDISSAKPTTAQAVTE